MSDVFLSYSRQDVSAAQLIAEALEREGFSVWKDNQIAAGDSYVNKIQRSLATAKAVVVLWSRASTASSWVMDEASYGRDCGILIPVALDNVELPLGFTQYQTVPLHRLPAGLKSQAFAHLVDAVRQLVGTHVEPPIAPTRERAAAKVERKDLPGAELPVERTRAYRRSFRAHGKSIFIAHTTADKPRIAPIVTILVRSGFKIWIDKPHLLKLDNKTIAKQVRGIEFGSGDWKEQIRKGVARANIVCAFWSNEAIDARREQFYYEVYMGLVQGKLCQCRIEAIPPTKIGFPFSFDQVGDLSDFQVGVYHPELDFMISGFAKFRRRIF